LIGDPRDLDSIGDDAYPGFAEQRELLRVAFGRLGLDCAQVWCDQYDEVIRSPQMFKASATEKVEATMLILMTWIKDHPRLLKN